MTKRGKRSVQALPASESLWNVYKDAAGKPPYLSVSKNPNDGTWWFSVWGETDEEVKSNLADLKRRQNDSGVTGARGAKHIGSRGATCAECGRGGPLVQDLEDGLMKHYRCCDIPPG
jgi:hypothetical protein